MCNRQLDFAGLVTYSVRKHHTELIHKRGPILSPQTSPSVTINTLCNRNAYDRLSFDRDFLLLLRFTIDPSVSLIVHMDSTRETWGTNVQVYQTPSLLSLCSQNSIGNSVMLSRANYIWVSSVTIRILSSLSLHLKHLKLFKRLHTISLSNVTKVILIMPPQYVPFSWLQSLCCCLDVPINTYLFCLKCSCT